MIGFRKWARTMRLSVFKVLREGAYLAVRDHLSEREEAEEEDSAVAAKPLGDHDGDDEDMTAFAETDVLLPVRVPRDMYLIVSSPRGRWYRLALPAGCSLALTDEPVEDERMVMVGEHGKYGDDDDN